MAIRAGSHRLIYVTPERLKMDACIAMLQARGVGLIAVDGAHCVAQWGHDFRPAYLAIAVARAKLGNPPMLALTATATTETADEIVAQLGLRAPRIVRTSLRRENLAFSVVRCVNEMAKRMALMELVADERQGSGIVYAATVKTADALFAWMTALGVPVARYHARMKGRERERSRASFMDGEARVMVATKAFGMGIDKADIRWVAHHQIPDSIESYYQEAGRAGRDGKPARCVLLHRLEDRRIQEFFIATKYPSRALAGKVLAATSPSSALAIRVLTEALAIGQRKLHGIVAHLEQLALVTFDGRAVRRRDPAQGDGAALEQLASAYDSRRARDVRSLAAVETYAQRVGCRVRYLLAYFGESSVTDCGRCDACLLVRAK